MLWSQEMSRISALDRQYFRLALMTGAWRPGARRGAARELAHTLERTVQGQPDFWTALGYDFVRFASRLPLRYSKWSPERINKYLSRFSGMNWAMAPLSWDERGTARQELYLFRPGSNGLLPVEDERLQQRRNEIIERHAERERRLRKEARKKSGGEGGGHNATSGQAGGQE
jgi:hypothetical protein